MRKVGFLVALSLFCLALSTTDYLNPLYPVYAEEGAADTSKNIIDPKDPRILKKMEEERQRMGSKEANLRMEADERREKITSTVAKLKDKMASREAALKQKLAQFKDRVKAAAVEKINNSLGVIQANRINLMKKHLEQLTKVLDTIETRINEMAAQGISVEDAKTAISDARTAITNAAQAVEAESERDYTIEVSGETTVKADAKASRDSLVNDLKSTQELVKKAKQAVSDALKAAKEAARASVSPSNTP